MEIFRRHLAADKHGVGQDAMATRLVQLGSDLGLSVTRSELLREAPLETADAAAAANTPTATAFQAAPAMPAASGRAWGKLPRGQSAHNSAAAAEKTSHEPLLPTATSIATPVVTVTEPGTTQEPPQRGDEATKARAAPALQDEGKAQTDGVAVAVASDAPGQHASKGDAKLEPTPRAELEEEAEESTTEHRRRQPAAEVTTALAAPLASEHPAKVEPDVEREPSAELTPALVPALPPRPELEGDVEPVADTTQAALSTDVHLQPPIDVASTTASKPPLESEPKAEEEQSANVAPAAASSAVEQEPPTEAKPARMSSEVQQESLAEAAPRVSSEVEKEPAAGVATAAAAAVSAPSPNLEPELEHEPAFEQKGEPLTGLGTSLPPSPPQLEADLREETATEAVPGRAVDAPREPTATIAEETESEDKADTQASGTESRSADQHGLEPDPVTAAASKPALDSAADAEPESQPLTDSKPAHEEAESTAQSVSAPLSLEPASGSRLSEKERRERAARAALARAAAAARSTLRPVAPGGDDTPVAPSLVGASDA